MKLLVEKKVHTKARDRFKNQLFGDKSDNLVLTWAIGSPENPMGIKDSDENNVKAKNLFEQMLSMGNFEFVKVKGKYGDEENSYFIPNISVEDAKEIFGKFNQQSFIYGEKTWSKEYNKYFLTMEYWEKADPDNPNTVYELKDLEDNVLETQDAVDYFTESHGFKFNIPFSIFQSVSDMLLKKYNWKSFERLFNEFECYVINSSCRVGSERYKYRGRMYHKPQGWEGSEGLMNQYYNAWN